MSLDLPAWLRPENMGAIVEKWAVLVNKTAVPTDVTQKPKHCTQLLV